MSMIRSVLALALGVCAPVVSAFAAEYDNTSQITFTLSGSGERRLVVEAIQGIIHVTGAGGSEIRVSLHEHWTAGSEASLAHGRSDVKVEMVQTGNNVAITLEGPFREHQRNSWREPHTDSDYHFRHDYEITVPRDISLDLRTVNGGDVSVSNVRGDLNLSNVNGPISMQNIAGSVRAKTVNGGIKGNFTENPTKGCSFQTLNGTVDITFQPDLNADVQLETMNGDAFTDFEIASVPTPVSTERSGNGRRFRISRHHVVRIGSGGVEHSFKTMNGSLKIRKASR